MFVLTLLCVLLAACGSVEQHVKNSVNESAAVTVTIVNAGSGGDVFQVVYDPDRTQTLTAYLTIYNASTSVAEGDRILLKSSDEDIVWVDQVMHLKKCDMVIANKTIHQRMAVTHSKLEVSLDAPCFHIEFAVRGMWLGYSSLTFHLLENTSQSGSGSAHVLLGSVVAVCIREQEHLESAFTITTQVLVLIGTLGMGVALDIEVIKRSLKRPLEVIIAMISQYLLMPLLAFAVVMMVGLAGGPALGLFLLGVAPGGGHSNMYCKLLGGDMSLSVTMTTLSTLASFAMLPLWIYTLGKALPENSYIGEIKIPFVNVLQVVASVVVPLLIGFLIKWKLVRIAAFIQKILKPLFIVLIIAMVVLALLSNQYIFHKLDWKLMVAACFLPYGGYVCGAVMACLFRLNWTVVKTISMETGMQNVAIAILITGESMNSPDLELSRIPLLTSAMMTYIPFYIITPLYMLWQRYQDNKDKEIKDECIATDAALQIPLNTQSTCEQG